VEIVAGIVARHVLTEHLLLRWRLGLNAELGAVDVDVADQAELAELVLDVLEVLLYPVQGGEILLIAAKLRR